VNPKYLIEEARQKPDDKIICVGDFNTGRCNLDVEHCAKYPRRGFESPSFGKLECFWTDAWRYMHRDREEFSYSSHLRSVRMDPSKRRGFRIDHCFVSAPLVSRIRSATYDRRPRETPYAPSKTLTNHSALIVEIDI
jgi:exonuclease III